MFRYDETRRVQSVIWLPNGGSELPPLNTEPRSWVGASLTVRPLLSTVVIWPERCAGVIGATRAEARATQALDGSQAPPSMPAAAHPPRPPASYPYAKLPLCPPRLPPSPALPLGEGEPEHAINGMGTRRSEERRVGKECRSR